MKNFRIHTLFFLIVVMQPFAHAQDMRDLLIRADDAFSKKDYETSLKLYRDVHDSRTPDKTDNVYVNAVYGMIFSLSNIGLDLQSSGNYFYADIYYNKAIQLLDNSAFSDNTMKAYLYHLIGINYEVSNQLGKAVEAYENALILNEYDDVKEYYDILRDLANVFYLLDKKLKARTLFQKTIEYYEKDIDNFGYELLSTYMRYGLLLSLEGENEKSEKLLLKALQLSYERYGENTNTASYVLNYLGNFYYTEGNYLFAIEYFHNTIKNLCPETGLSVYNNPLPENLIPNDRLLYALRYKAHSFYQYYIHNSGNVKDLEASLATFDITFILIEKIRFEAGNEESGLLFGNSYRETIKNALATVAELYRLTGKKEYLAKLFEYVERAKASMLYSSVSETNKLLSGGVPRSLISYDNRLKNDIARVKQKLQQPGNTLSGEEADSLYRMLKRRSEIKEQLGHKYNIVDTLSTPIGLKELMQCLQEDELLLSYCLTDSLLYCFAITRHDAGQVITDIDSSFINDILLLRKHVATPDLNRPYSELVREFTECSGRLYNKLILPVEEKLKGKRLIIIPDDKLLYIPFEVLVKPGTKASGFDRLPYMVKEHAVSYSYSASLRYKAGIKNRKREASIIAVAPGYKECPGDWGLKDLPFASEESGYIAKAFEGKCITGKEATEGYFKRNAGSYDIIHLAMHTDINDNYPMLSALNFACSNDTAEDGELKVYELYQMELKARLVVLNGCNTGSGSLLRGEGLYNLARGFICSGCPSLVLSLWELYDESGSSIIRKFYDSMGEGLPLDVALQQSKLAYLENAGKLEAHPFYWSGIAMIGDTTPVIKKPINTVAIALSAVIIILIAGLMYIYQKKTKE